MINTITLGELTSTTRPICYGVLKPGKLDPNGIPLVRVTDISSNFFNDSNLYKISPALDKQFSRSKLKGGELLLSIQGTVGKVAICPIEYAGANISRTIAVIEPDKRLLKDYLRFYFIHMDIEGKHYSTGSTRASLNISYIRNLKIPLPPLDQQKKIAVVLDAADAYRQKTKALIEKYDELTQSLFLDMFGDPMINPKGWESSKLGLLVENKDSKRIPVKSIDRDNMSSEFPYYGASGVIDYVDDYTHEGDNLLIGEDGANLLARSTPIAFIAKGQYWVNNHAHVLGYNGKSLLVFLEFYINLINLSPYISGSAQPKLNRKNMDQIEVYCPPLKLQNQFADRVQAIEEQKAQAEASLAQAEDLFNSLLQRAFKGELTKT